jgi:CheY-like chemotaxis protein
MTMSAHSDALLDSLSAPAAIVGPRGELAAWNSAFTLWVGVPESALAGARVDVHAERGLLHGTGVRGASPALHVTPLAAGGWLALGLCPPRDPTVSMARALGAQLRVVESNVRVYAGAGLEESPSSEVAGSLREILGAADELRQVVRNVEALAGAASSDPSPTCLRNLVRSAAQAFPAGAVRVEVAADADVTVALHGSHLFLHVVSLLGVLTEISMGPVSAILTGVAPPSGGSVHLRLRFTPPPSDTEDGWIAGDPALVGASAYVAAVGGRLLRETDQLVLELPAYAPRMDGLPGLARGTVLVAEDDDEVRAMMSSVLRRAGWDVLGAEDGVAAVALLRRHVATLSAVVADAVLPGRSGMEIIAEARRARPTLPVLLVSGHASDLLLTEGSARVPVLTKPFGATTLADRLRALVRTPDTAG